MNLILRNAREIEKDIAQLRKALTLGTTRALNKTARSAKTKGAKEIRKQINLKAKLIKGKLILHKASKKKDVAIISALGRGTLLTNYPNKQLTKKAINGGRKNAGIRIKVKRKGASFKLKRGFYIKLNRGTEAGAGKMAIAYRTGKGRKDFAIAYGPSVSQVWNKTRDMVTPETLKTLERNMDNEINFALSKIK